LLKFSSELMHQTRTSQTELMVQFWFQFSLATGLNSSSSQFRTWGIQANQVWTSSNQTKLAREEHMGWPVWPAGIINCYQHTWLRHSTGTSPCTNGEDEDMGSTNDSTKMSQLIHQRVIDQELLAPDSHWHWPAYRVPHRYGFKWGFQVTGHVGIGMVLNLGSHVKTVPLTMVFWVWWYHNLFGGCIGSNLILGYC